MCLPALFCRRLCAGGGALYRLLDLAHTAAGAFGTPQKGEEQGMRRVTTRGFTLLEALVVLALLALLLGLAAPNLSGWRLRQQLQAQADEFYASVLLTRTQALLQQQHVTMCSASRRNGDQQCDAQADWHAGWLVFADSNRNGLREPQEPLLLQGEGAARGIRIVGNSTVNRQIGYGSDGRSERLSGAFLAGTIQLCASGERSGWQVVINAIGRARLEKTTFESCP